MNGVEVVRSGFGGAHMWYLGTVGDLTAEQINAVPAGVTPPISALMAHILHTEDFMMSMVVLGQPPLWEREGWKDKVGGPMLLAQEAASSRAYRGDPAKLAEYAVAVFANTDVALGTLTEADLDREADLRQFGFPTNMPLGAFLSQMVLGNSYAHTGEISALKGTMEMKGYPF